MIIAYIVAYIISYIFAATGHYYLSGAALILAAIVLYVTEVRRTGNLIDLRALFSLGFVGGEGISCLKLSRLQTKWELMTWICFFVAFLAFWFAYEAMMRFVVKKTPVFRFRHITDYGRLRICILVITAVSLAAFIVEAAVLGYVPLLVRGVPHAYSEFHISGVHYFTLACVLVPAMSTLWFLRSADRTAGQSAAVIAADVVALLIPILCVSRFHIVAAVLLAAFSYLILQKRIPWKLVAGLIAAMIPVLFILTLSRSHDAEYLNSIFEMKYDMPVSLSRAYIYIANNYDNFNCLVRDLPEHTWGLRMLFPLWAFTGLKFISPSLVSFPIYITKTELTTVTLFYDAFYDFGIIGMTLFAAAIGAVCSLIERIVRQNAEEGGCYIYAQAAVYMLFSFFTTWFSNPNTWFWLGVSVIVFLVTSKRVDDT